jgi:hypothetical protein
MERQPRFYVRKVAEVIALMSLAFWLQFQVHFMMSALVMALTWQQLGWSVPNQ